MSGGYGFPALKDIDLSQKATFMGQSLLDPPSVEGWHTGTEWIYTGALVDRVNFAVDEVGDATRPGVRAILDRVRGRGEALSPSELVDACLDLLGPMDVSDQTRRELVDQASRRGLVRFGSADGDQEATRTVLEVLQTIVSTREYQLA